MDNDQTPTRPEILEILSDNNWSRWGDDDQKGAINLITREKIIRAARLVEIGRSLSLSRVFPTEPHAGNPTPAQHFMKVMELSEGAGAALDYYGLSYHGYACTHIDALSHIWQNDTIYGGRRPEDVISYDGATACDVDQWREGIITRGILLDVPGYRGESYVTLEQPVEGRELERIASGRGIDVRPGDAVFVYSGREAWEEERGPINWNQTERPGLHASCMGFIHERDVAVLGWDMMDATPNEYGIQWAVHGMLQAHGVALLDNVVLGDLARTCAELNRWEFMLVVAPLRVVGGTGSPVNPIAVF